MPQVMACCLTAPSHNLGQCWSRCMSPYVITRPQWVKVEISITQWKRTQSFEWFIANRMELQWVCNVNLLSSLWLSRTTLHLGSFSSLVQVMALCLTVPSHYLNRYRLFIKRPLRNNFQWNRDENTKFFIHQKGIWTWHLQNSNHFVQASVC